MTGILVRPAKDGGITIDSNDGHRAFNVTCPDSRWKCDEPILLDAKAFKKRISHARFVSIIRAESDDCANVLGGKGPDAEILQAIPWKWKQRQLCNDKFIENPATVYPNVDQIWPDRFGRATEAPISFNATLLADFLAMVKLYSWSNTVTMQRNAAHNPMLFESIIKDTHLENVVMRFLLMPMQIRI